jgi:hypothetical protein
MRDVMDKSEKLISALVNEKGRSFKNVKLRNRHITHIFYITAMVYMTVLVFAGFWASYFGQLFADLPTRHWFIHLHAAVFTGWLVLLLVQASLVASGNTKLHRKLGVAGGIYGLVIVLLGLIIAFLFPIQNIESGIWSLDEAASFLILPLGDMLIFSGFFGAAIWYRSKIEIHKRLILLASVMLVFPAVARIFGETQIFALVFFWLAPVMAGIILDRVLHKKIHPVYLLGVAVFLMSIARMLVWQSEGWLLIGRSLLGFFI